jgi:transposase InsO family protein
VLDNGPEFTGKTLDQWACEHRVALQFIEPGKPVQNAFVESFNGILRNECLNEHWCRCQTACGRLADRLQSKQTAQFAGRSNPGGVAILHSTWGGQTLPINNNLTMESSHNN